MAEAAALLLAASIVQQLGFTNATFFTDNQSLANFTTPRASPTLHIGR
jgi:ribonuclease HI